MKEISHNFPEGLAYEIPFDMTTYISESIHEVYKTLFEALFLVIIVVFLSLQSWRATLIPIVAVPISLIGTFGFMLIFGFSLNMLTLLGLILAIGIVVDDAIVVVENVERIMEDEKLSPYEATKKAMNGLTRRPDCHVAGTGSRVRPGKFPVGYHRNALPAIYRYDCRIGHHIHSRGAYAQPGHVLSHSANPIIPTERKTSYSATSTCGCTPVTVNTCTALRHASANPRRVMLAFRNRHCRDSASQPHDSDQLLTDRRSRIFQSRTGAS